MFNHPEGQSHPWPPSHLKKLGRYNFGEDIFGMSFNAIKNFIHKNTSIKNQNKNKKSLAQKVRDFIYLKENRNRYVNFANKYLKEKKTHSEELYDVILIGAGIHAATYIYTLKKTNPKAKVLIVEKSSDICATFFKLGDSLVLNSPTFTKVGLNSNIIQGHFIQTSDFDELLEKPFPTAKHLYELTTMVLLHADADILFDYDVKKITKKRENLSISNNKYKIHSKNIIISNGMGEQKSNSFKKDRLSKKIISGDNFISSSYKDKSFFEQIRDKRIAVVGSGDTANCVMEYLLPLVYPNYYYGFYRKDSFLPNFIYWVGQDAKNIQDYFFANKSRYCHSGGVIEFFWNEETPFELSTEIWKKTKELIKCIPDKLLSLNHHSGCVNLEMDSKSISVDLVIDCTGRSNKLGFSLLQNEYEFIERDITLYGGQWNEEMEQFVVTPRLLQSKKIACKIKDKNIFFLGSTCPLDELIDNEEARNGSLKYQEDRKSLTNSKWSLEHTLPRTVSFAENYLNFLDKDI